MESIVFTPDLMLQWYLLGVISLFPMVNPFSTIPLLLSLTRNMPDEARSRQALRAVVYSAFLMEGTLLAGSLVLAFFNISVPSLRIAGGLVVAFLGFRMLFPSTDNAKSVASEQDPGEHPDYSFVPLAFPSLCGAGTMAVLISFSSTIGSANATIPVKFAAHVAGLLAIITVSAVTALLLRSSVKVARYLGDSGMGAIERIMGLLMVCIGVQFIANGIKDFIHMSL